MALTLCPLMSFHADRQTRAFVQNLKILKDDMQEYFYYNAVK